MRRSRVVPSRVHVPTPVPLKAIVRRSMFRLRYEGKMIGVNIQYWVTFAEGRIYFVVRKVNGIDVVITDDCELKTAPDARSQSEQAMALVIDWIGIDHYSANS